MFRYFSSSKEVFLDGKMRGRTFYFVNYEARKDNLFELPRTTLAMKINSSGARNNADQYRFAGRSRRVTVIRPGFEDSFSASDNCIWLDAGESQTIQVSETAGLQATAWNLKAQK